MSLEVVGSATSELVRTGVLGSMLVLVGSFAFWITTKWMEISKERVKDQQEITKVIIELSSGMKDVLKELKMSVDNVKEVVKDMSEEDRRTHRELSDTINDLDNTLNSILRDAVRNSNKKEE